MQTEHKNISHARKSPTSQVRHNLRHAGWGQTVTSDLNNINWTLIYLKSVNLYPSVAAGSFFAI